MHQHVSSQQHHMTSTSGGSQVVRQTYQVQQQQQSYQQHYGGQQQPGQQIYTPQQPANMQQQYRFQQQLPTHQGGYTQPLQSDRIVQDSSYTRQQEFISKGSQQPSHQQPIQLGQQQPQSFLVNQDPNRQQFQQSPQQYNQQSQSFAGNQDPNRHQFQQSFQPYNQFQPFNQQQSSELPSETVEKSFIPQSEDDEFLRRPTRKLQQQWPPQQTVEEIPKQQFEPGMKGTIAWPPLENMDDENVQYQPNSIGQQNIGMLSKPFENQNSMSNPPHLELRKYPTPPSVQNQASPQQLSGFNQNPQGHIPKQIYENSPNTGGYQQGAKLPERLVTVPGSNIPKDSGFGKGIITPKGKGIAPGFNPMQTKGPGISQVTLKLKEPGIPQNTPIAEKIAPKAVKQGTGNPLSQGQINNAPYQGVKSQPASNVETPKSPQVTSPPVQPQQPSTRPQYSEPLTLPRGNIQNQAAMFDKPHSYNPTECDLVRPLADGNLPEWPPKSAPSQPAFKLTTPMKKKGDDVWPPQGAFQDEPSTDVRDFERPTKSNKSYDSFFSANMVPNNYPGYRAPPGTQHVGYMDDAQPL